MNGFNPGRILFWCTYLVLKIPNPNIFQPTHFSPINLNSNPPKTIQTSNDPNTIQPTQTPPNQSKSQTILELFKHPKNCPTNQPKYCPADTKLLKHHETMNKQIKSLSWTKKTWFMIENILQIKVFILYRWHFSPLFR